MSSQSLSTPYLVLAGAVAFAILVAFMVLQPMYKTTQGTKDEIASTQAKLVEKETFLRTLDSKLADLQLKKDDENRLNVMLPQSDRMEDVLRILHTSAADSGITLDQINNASGAAQSEAVSAQARGDAAALPTTVVPLGLSLDVTGPYQGIRKFVGELEKTPRLMDITRLDLQVNDQQPDQIVGQLGIQFYRLKDNATAAP